MARADQLKKLFLGFEKRDDRAFLKAAQEIIEDERRKHHKVVANELQSILDDTSKIISSGMTIYDPPPFDKDRQSHSLKSVGPIVTCRASYYRLKCVAPSIAPWKNSRDGIFW